MIQRLIYNSILVGVNTYAAAPDQSLMAELFKDIWLLSDAEILAIYKYFQSHPIQLAYAYRRVAMDNKNPICFISETSQAQPGFALGDQAGGTQVVTPDGQVVAGAPVLGSFWDHQLQISLYAHGNYELVLYLCEIIKTILLAAKPLLLSYAIELPVMSISDAQPAEPYEPEMLWQRQISLRCRREFSINNTADTLQRAFKVAGISGQAGSPQSDGGVLSLVSL